jgi:putative endonuclease
LGHSTVTGRCTAVNPLSVIGRLDRPTHPDSYPRMQAFYVYILASRKRGTLYIGVTNDIARRVYEHRTGTASSFTCRYDVFRLVYFETFPTAVEAIRRETVLKRWKRQWKIDLIEKDNPEWFDLYRGLNR